MSARNLCRWAAGLSAIAAAAYVMSPPDAHGRGPSDNSGSIGDRVWLDSNANGVQDTGEPGIPLVALTLLPEPSTPGGDLGVFTTITDAEGKYFFDNLPLETSYRVVVDASNFQPGAPLAGLVSTLAFVGDDTSVDNDGANPVVRLVGGVVASSDVDFGFGSCSSCQGGATALSIRYRGNSTRAGGITILDETGATLFSSPDPVNPGDTFTVSRPGGEPLGNVVRVLIGGSQNAVFDSSCSCCTVQAASMAFSGEGVNPALVRDILVDIGQPAAPGSPMDLDGNGAITVADLNRALAGDTVPRIALGEMPDAVLLTENFEGSAVGWLTSGLWHLTDMCRKNPVCDGGQWAYFGMSGPCHYATRNPIEAGLLTSPPITLPAFSGCDGIVLSYCSLLRTSGDQGAQTTRVLCNGTVIDVVNEESPFRWRTRTVDLTAFAGQTVTLSWEFATTDTQWHRSLGWQVDNVKIIASSGGAACIGPGLLAGDFEIFAGASSAGLLCDYSVCCDPEATEGACCLSDGTCIIVDGDENFSSGQICTSMGGVFGGPGTNCDDYNCSSRIGACCIPDDNYYSMPENLRPRNPWPDAGPATVCVDTTILSCVAAGGTFLGVDVTCKNGICQLAACCVQSRGICSVIPPALCYSIGGYAGPIGSDCGDIYCPPKGACCLPNGQCRTKTQQECAYAYGVYQGNYTNCYNAYCPPTGACCVGQDDFDPSNGGHGGGVCQVVTQNYCENVLWGVYKGDNTPCGPETCAPGGACCLVLGLCHSNLTRAQCDHLLGYYNGPGTSCSQINCAARGACCTDIGCVPLLTVAGCQIAKGTWAGSGVHCSDADCPPARRCCLPNGQCVVKTEAACMDLNGVWSESHHTCIGANCNAQKACCLPNGGCVRNTSIAQCEVVLGGDWIPSTNNCTTANCPQPEATGACCFSSTGTCQVLTRTQCMGMSGNYLGDNTACTACPCTPNTPSNLNRGACCFSAGQSGMFQCVEVTPQGCSVPGATFHPGRCCADISCPPPT